VALMGRPVRILFLSDTHLGFDEPLRPRSRKPHRGPDFFATFQRALDIARAERVDAVIHGGDLFYRSRVPDSLIDRAMAPLVELAEAGIPVFLVAGNHERSFLPRTLFSLHDRIHVFDQPGTARLTVDGTRLSIGGFPCARHAARDSFPRLVAATGLEREPSEVRVLCIHQLVEGARVFAHQFRDGEDVVRASDLPGHLTVVLSGHVHRHQVLRTDLSGAPLPAPVVYAGSTERTSFAEAAETKGFVSIVIGPGGSLESVEQHPLPARPMYVRTVEPGPLPAAIARLRSSLQDVDIHGILRVRILEDTEPDRARVVAAVTAVVPATMFLSFTLPPGSGRSYGPGRS
jgi:DNA repair protein SbcD/Mre11